MSERTYTCGKKGCYYCQEMARLEAAKQPLPVAEVDKLTMKYYQRKTNEIKKLIERAA